MTADDAARLPRPLLLLILGAIMGAAMFALVRPQFNATPPSPTTDRPGDTHDGVGVVLRQIEGPGAASRIGAAAPDFEWSAPDGRTVRLSDLRGRTVVVNFWATWCVPCRTELPLLDAVAHDDPDLVVVGVDLQEDVPAVRAYFERYGLSGIQPLLDPDAETFRRWNVFTLPTTYFIDRDGYIQHLAIGAMTEDAIRAGIRKARGA